MYALVDCNCFYVSCERVFNPALEGKPMVVLSNNDGCSVSRSDEAKAMGIAMAAPIFEYKEIIEKNHVECFSSNYTLYDDMSRRVMSMFEMWTPDIEVYSIDEAFVLFSETRMEALAKVAEEMRLTIFKWTGIPVIHPNFSRVR